MSGRSEIRMEFVSDKGKFPVEPIEFALKTIGATFDDIENYLRKIMDDFSKMQREKYAESLKGNSELKNYAEQLDEKAIDAVNSVISKGDRVEIIPFRDGTVKVIKIKRDEVKQN